MVEDNNFFDKNTKDIMYEFFFIAVLSSFILVIKNSIFSGTGFYWADSLDIFGAIFPIFFIGIVRNKDFYNQWRKKILKTEKAIAFIIIGLSGFIGTYFFSKPVPSKINFSSLTFFPIISLLDNLREIIFTFALHWFFYFLLSVFLVFIFLPITAKCVK